MTNHHAPEPAKPDVIHMLSVRVMDCNTREDLCDDCRAMRAAIAEIEALRKELKKQAQGWGNAVELDLLPDQHKMSAKLLKMSAEELAR
jgi:hypothetical protein